MNSAKDNSGYFIINFTDFKFIDKFVYEFSEKKIFLGTGKKENFRSWREVKYARFQRKAINSADLGSEIPGKNDNFIDRKID